METEALFFWMDTKEIGFLRFLLEAYEGMAALTTLDRERGLVMARIAPGCIPLVKEVIASLGPQSVFSFLNEEDVRAMGCSPSLCLD